MVLGVLRLMGRGYQGILKLHKNSCISEKRPKGGVVCCGESGELAFCVCKDFS